jgi:cyclopropane fatty-acyl-phospholipid synthase-like methyltransferase
MINGNYVNRRLKNGRRLFYGLRFYVPFLRERHELECMVGPLGFWKELQSYQLKALMDNGLRPEHKVLDIGCGPLQGGIAFIGFLERNNYYGVDIKPKSIEAGINQIKKLKLSHKNPFVSVSNSFGKNELKDVKFNFIWASQLLYYFNDEELEILMGWVTEALAKDGKFLGDILSPKHYEFRNKEHGWSLHTINSLDNIAKQFDLTIKNIGEIKNFGYPKRLSLTYNNLIEITKARP